MEPMETSNYSIFSKMEKIYQIYRHFLWIALFLFSVLALCIMCWIFKFYIGLFFILSISLYTLFILSLWSFFVIISEYCERKNINLSNIFSSKFSIFLYIILLIFNLLFVLCGFSRLFIIINNIALASFNDFNCDFLNIYCIIIIILLLTTTVLSWINVFNKKAKVGKLNLLLVLIAIIGSSLLFYNILYLETLPETVGSVLATQRTVISSTPLLWCLDNADYVSPKSLPMAYIKAPIL